MTSKMYLFIFNLEKLVESFRNSLMPGNSIEKTFVRLVFIERDGKVVRFCPIGDICKIFEKDD